MKTKVFFLLLLSCFLLNMVPAKGVITSPSYPADSINIQQVLSPKDEAVIRKFDNAKRWLAQKASQFSIFFEEAIANLKAEIDKLSEEIITKFEELKNEVINNNYTLMKVQMTDNTYATSC